MTRPALFLDLDFQAALDRSKAEGKLLLVDATAEWCQPCKAMDKTTWSNEAVAARLGAIAIPIQLDVDRDKPTAETLRIKAMPTVVLFRDGAELGRISGTRSPEALLHWVDEAIAGRAPPDEMAEQEKVVQEVVARSEKFFALLKADQFDEATEHGMWLWKNIGAAGPPMLGVKHTVVAAGLKKLAAARPAVAAELRELRDATPIDATNEEGLALIGDWAALNAALDDDARTITWFEDIVDQLAENVKLAQLVRFRVVPLLVERARWRDVGRAYADPMASVRRGIATRARMDAAPVPPQHKERIRDAAAKGFREECGLIVRGLRAADRIAEANEVVAAATEADPSPEMKAALTET